MYFHCSNAEIAIFFLDASFYKLVATSNILNDFVQPELGLVYQISRFLVAERNRKEQ